MNIPKLTPLMQSYLDMRATLDEDSILLCRLGDFYEIFFDDATNGAKILGIALTQRHGINMAGIPYHALDNYLPKLLNAGIKVAIAEQIEDPKEVKARIVKREIVKIITPGSITQDSVLDEKSGNYFTCIYAGQQEFGLSSIDLSTGDFLIMQVNTISELLAEITRINPRECLISEKQINYFHEHKELLENIVLSSSQQLFFDDAENFLCQHFSIQNTTSLGCQDIPLASMCAGALLRHLRETLLNKITHISSLRICHPQNYLLLDDTSQRNLELVQNLYKQQSDTLLSILDKCSTVMGSRLLREWILRPLKNKQNIIARQESIKSFTQSPMSLEELAETLNVVRDIQRIITRLDMGGANARDLLNLKSALSIIPSIHTIFSYINDLSPLLKSLLKGLKPLPDLVNLLEQTIDEQCPISLRDGSIIKKNYNPQLDELRLAAENGNQLLYNFEQQQKEELNIKALKVRYNKNFGYFVEISNSAKLEKVPDHYIRRQTLSNSERYTTEKLKDIESLILGASEKSKRLEFDIFENIREKTLDYLQDILDICQIIAQVDCLSSLARVALYNDYTCPTISEEKILNIVDGRHPIGEKINPSDFIANNTNMNDNAHFQLITGPNMAGKSTYIRQVALLVIMTQMGSFIPAQEAIVGIFDAVFTRIGASDNLSKGQSTFMVEMSETAHILNNCTNNSLVILDEIGRGTSTYDGLSLAWSITEFLEKKKTFTLFATHYHELTKIAQERSGLENYNVSVQEKNGNIYFLYKIIAGAANRSYGIQVASIAGIPLNVLKRANQVLTNLEKNSSTGNNSPIDVNALQRSLFD